MNIVILAAGQGKRMNSALPKVLHPLAGQPILAHVLATARQLKETSSVGAIVVVHGHGGEAVRAAFPQNDIEWVLQAEQLGTGHAVRQAMPLLDPARPTLVLSGDVPLVEVSTLRHLMEAAKNNETLAILTVTLGDATGYGRIVRDGQGRIVRIVEQKEANENERTLREINTGIMVLPTGRLGGWLSALSNQNAQNEYYLTDVIAMAVREGGSVTSAAAQGEWEVLGINSKTQLAQVERLWQQRNARRLMEAGAMLADPARIDVRMNENLIGLTCGRDVSIDVNCVFIGEVVLGDGVQVGANCILDNTRVGAGTKIAAFSILEKTEIGAQASVGPYARLRVGTVLADTARVGNFVEVKNSRIGKGSKANHLAYVGDAEVGERVNIGAGVITCNYDGAYKYKTVIGDDVFIGSDSQLVAPVSIGAGATIGAGTTLTKDVEAGNLAVSRTPQRVKAGWVRPSKDSSVKS